MGVPVMEKPSVMGAIPMETNKTERYPQKVCKQSGGVPSV